MTVSEVRQQLRENLEQDLPDYLQMLKKMVDINSFTSNPAGVDRLGQLMISYFTRLGFTVERVLAENPRFGHHLVLTRPGRSTRKIGLVSHLDTVFPAAEEAENNFVWREVEDRIYGPGTVDIKGGTVMIYMLLAALQTVLPEVYEDVTWVILLNAAEEELVEDFGQLCQDHLTEEGLACLVFEGGNWAEDVWSVVTARKGRAIYHITTTGRGAHAGAAHPAGANALVQLGHTIQQIAALTDYERELTFNVGAAMGGSVVNRVPHQATAAVEMRTFSPDVFRAGVEQMLALNGPGVVQSGNGQYGCQVQVELLTEAQPWDANPQSDQLLQLWQAAATELGYTVAAEARGGLSDGNWTWDVIPTLDGLGPIGANAHCSEQSADGEKEQEFVLRSSFVPKTMLNILAILKLLER